MVGGGVSLPGVVRDHHPISHHEPRRVFVTREKSWAAAGRFDQIIRAQERPHRPRVFTGTVINQAPLDADLAARATVWREARRGQRTHRVARVQSQGLLVSHC